MIPKHPPSPHHHHRSRQRTRHPSVLKIAVGGAAFVVLVFLISVPRDLWPGLFPSSTGGKLDGDIVPARVSHGPLEDILHDIHRNFTRVWKEHSDHAVPQPVYAGPALTAAQKARYAHLRRPPATRHSKITAEGKNIVPKYMFTTIVRDIGAQLPDLLNALAVVTLFVGPEHVSFSIVEGPSGDPTPHILRDQLRPMLLALGVAPSAINIETDAKKIDFNRVNRIEELAKLRNRALEPLWKDVDQQYLGKTPPGRRRTVGADVAAVVFFNDVFLHATDILELLHQHIWASRGNAGTGITAAWDWMERDPAFFYDVWVSHTIDTGDIFYPINQAWWSASDDILSTSPSSRAAYDQLRPFQAYSAWNGMAVLSPTPFLPPTNVRFRRSDPKRDECAASECTLIAADFWKYGYGRVQVVPSVQLAYGRDVALKTAVELRKTQAKLGWKEWEGVPPYNLDTTVSWIKEPPANVRCNPWPEKNGLDANVWENTLWVKPYVL